MHELIEWLKGAIPGQARTSIVHGDYSFHNLLSHPTEPRIAAVLDWELSTIGDPLADFTYFTQPWFAPVGERSFAGHDLAALGVPDYATVRDRYCERIGEKSIPHERFSGVPRLPQRRNPAGNHPPGDRRHRLARPPWGLHRPTCGPVRSGGSSTRGAREGYPIAR